MRTLKLRKADDFDALRRYYVLVDGIKLGWVCHSHDGTWSGYANVRENDVLTAKCVSQGDSRRRHAVLEVLIAVTREGGVYQLNDRFRNEFVEVSAAALDMAQDEL